MPRDIQVRENYTTELVRLNRLRTSARRDSRQSPEWHEQTESAIEALIKLLANASV